MIYDLMEIDCFFAYITYSGSGISLEAMIQES